MTLPLGVTSETILILFPLGFDTMVNLDDPVGTCGTGTRKDKGVQQDVSG
jgi:hypothetical protein